MPLEPETLDVVNPTRVGVASFAISLIVLVLTQFLKSPYLKEVIVKVGAKYRVFVVAGITTLVSVANYWLLGSTLEEAVMSGAGGFFMAVAQYKIILEDWFGHKTGTPKTVEGSQPDNSVSPEQT